MNWVEWVLVFIILFVCIAIVVFGVSFLCNAGLIKECKPLLEVLLV